MTVTPLPASSASPSDATGLRPAPSAIGADEPDTALRSDQAPAASGFGRALLDAFDAASTALGRADGAERAFAAGRGGLQEMVLERAQADVALSLASTAAGRVTQALGTVLGMQV